MSRQDDSAFYFSNSLNVSPTVKPPADSGFFLFMDSRFPRWVRGGRTADGWSNTKVTFVLP